jgi:hypothetical protein
VSKFFDRLIAEVEAEVGRLGTLGSAEIGSALYMGHAYTPYGAGQQPVEAGQETPQVVMPEMEQDMGMGR